MVRLRNFKTLRCIVNFQEENVIGNIFQFLLQSKLSLFNFMKSISQGISGRGVGSIILEKIQQGTC